MTYVGSRKWPYLLSVLAGGLIAFGLLTVFALYGLVPLIIGGALIALAIKEGKGSQRWQAPLLGLAGAVVVLALLLYGAEHVWSQPSCQQHPNQTGGSVTYWSGAHVTWKCVNGQPVVIQDTR